MLKRSHALFGLVAGWAVAAQAQTPTRPTESAQAAASDAASVSTVPTKSVKSAAPLVAVMAFEGRQVSADEAQILSEALAAEMSRSGEVRLMERSQMDKILSEQGFQKSGACSGTECAVEVGQLLGIDRMVVGSVGKLGRSFVLVARMVDVASGEVLKSSTRQAQGEIDQILTGLVPMVASDLTGGGPRSIVPPVAKFSSPPPADLWTDSVIVSWQASGQRPLAEVRAWLARPSKPDSAIATVSRKETQAFANGNFLMILPATLDTGSYLLRLSAKDAADAVSAPMDAVVKRHGRIRESGSHWGWWLVGGLVMIGGTGGATWVAVHDNKNNSNNGGRSLVVSWQ